jgi:hypothetical protein
MLSLTGEASGIPNSVNAVSLSSDAGHVWAVVKPLSVENSHVGLFGILWATPTFPRTLMRSQESSAFYKCTEFSTVFSQVHSGFTWVNIQCDFLGCLFHMFVEWTLLLRGLNRIAAWLYFYFRLEKTLISWSNQRGDWEPRSHGSDRAVARNTL